MRKRRVQVKTLFVSVASAYPIVSAGVSGGFVDDLA